MDSNGSSKKHILYSTILLLNKFSLSSVRSRLLTDGIGSHETSPIGTDAEDDFDTYLGVKPYELQGVLSKWTNYVHGWQNRFFILKEGTLSYYKSEHELSYGCRGSISVLKATIKVHEVDECRLDISVNDCAWYLRAENVEDKNKWVEGLEHCKVDSGFGSENSLKRHGSAISISSNTQSNASGTSGRSSRTLKVKQAELETYRDILIRQIDTLQKYFDACASTAPLDSFLEEPNNLLLEKEHSESPLPPDLSAVDFRGEALTFKATTEGVLTAISLCIEVMSQAEDVWRKRLDREVEKWKKVEEHLKQTLKEAQDQTSKMMIIGPDCEEGPHSALKEDEFYDAVELGLDKMEEDEAFRERFKNIQSVSKGVAESHPLWPEIERVTMDQLHYAQLGLGEGGWELFAEDGEMRMYKREEEVNGLVCDPLKAVHTVKGITAHELCHYFFAPEVRMEWEITVEQSTVLEKISDDTLMFLQIHKRVWPTAQRDAVFWSHIRKVPESQTKDPKAHSTWIVCNNSTDNALAPAQKYVRVILTVCMVCQTFIEEPKNGGEITRDNITTKITYCSVVNPGGWAPAVALRAVYKREYPKFLKKFTQYVTDKTKSIPILL